MKKVIIGFIPCLFLISAEALSIKKPLLPPPLSKEVSEFLSKRLSRELFPQIEQGIESINNKLKPVNLPKWAATQSKLIAIDNDIKQLENLWREADNILKKYPKGLVFEYLMKKDNLKKQLAELKKKFFDRFPSYFER